MRNYTVNELAHDPAFRRWARGEASPAEVKYWDEWVQQSVKNRDKAHRAQAEIMGYAFNSKDDAYERNEEWKKLERKLEAARQPKNNRSPRFQWILRVAALLCIGIGLAWAVYSLSGYTNELDHNSAKTITVTTDFGKKKTVSLSDGSRIVVNANSEISYMSGKNKNKEIVVKLNGEAYFDIAHRKSPDANPFIVQTDDGKVSVLGTKFSVSTHDATTRVVLKEGLVRVNPTNLKNGKGTPPEYLRPGEMAHFDARKSIIEIKKVNAAVYTAWANGKLIFDKTPLAEVASRIEKTFGVEVVFANQSLRQRLISGAIENSSLGIIIEGLSQTLRIPAEVEENTVFLGEFD